MSELPKTRKEFQEFLRSHGFSKRIAEKIAVAGFHSPVDDDEEKHELAELSKSLADLTNKLK